MMRAIPNIETRPTATAPAQGGHRQAHDARPRRKDLVDADMDDLRPDGTPPLRLRAVPAVRPGLVLGVDGPLLYAVRHRGSSLASPGHATAPFPVTFGLGVLFAGSGSPLRCGARPCGGPTPVRSVKVQGTMYHIAP